MKKFMSRGWFTCVFVCLSCFLISEKLSAEVNGGDEVRTVTLNMWNVSLKEILTEIEKQAGVTFSYESSLLKEFQKTSFKVNDAALDDCLARLFAGYPFVYKRTGNIVVLKRKPRQVTISGFVRDKTSAESLVGASVYEVNSLSGVAANTYGFFSLSLPVPSGSDGAPVRLQASYIGYESHLFTIPVLKQDTVLVIDLQPNAAIGEVLVTALETTRQTVRSTQMGTLEVNHATIRATPTLLGEADIIRTLQLTPGVSAGTEGISGLYVRGGNSDENLFLVDGNPVYQVNHIGGFFSAFNNEAIKGMNFFKAGFPARYGGRLSSVVDVHTKEGNMKEFHGSASLGLVSGNLNLEGPIWKDRTSFNIALRRTWLDVLTAPVLAIVNKKNKKNGERINVRYAFHDLNARIDHRFSDRSRMYLSLYNGNDVLKVGSEDFAYSEYTSEYRNTIDAYMRWGNLVASAGWTYAFSNKLFGKLSGFYTRYRSKIRYKEEDVSGKETDMRAFKKKLYEHKIKKDRDSLSHFVLTSITTMRYDHPEEEPTIKFEHILLFALAGGLVILCALFNYLTLFVNRIRIRSKEIGLRKVCGSSDGNLFVLFASEYLLTLSISLLAGIALIEVILPVFQELSNVKTDSFSLYLETFVYFGFITLLAFLFSLFPIYYFRKRSLQKALKGSSDGKGKNLFPKASLILQLIISIGFIFCSSVLIKQIHHLHTTDIGLNRKDRGDVRIYPQTDGLKEEIAKLSSIAEVYPDENDPLFPSHSRSYRSFTDWEGKPASVEGLTIQIIPCNNRYFEFYGLQLLKGKLPEGDTERHILLNEAAVKELKIDNPIGKTLSRKDQKGFIIDGIFKDFYIAPPTVPVKPVMLEFSPGKKNIQNDYSTTAIFRHQPGSRELCKQQVEQLAKKMQPNAVDIHVTFMEEEYEKFLKSEKALLKMLDFVTIVCILISLFGVFSQVTLDCEQKKKEIAVRKVNGAEASDIMRMFFAGNLRLLCIASVIAFPASYLIMKSWIENYVLQAAISWWLYPVIWGVLVLLLTLCTGWRIQKAANQNPAEVIKSE
ncbi:FtsX-like permease family protein [Parabacteroides merdae]|uniref:FtsX-like permease family protein n=4 Tax=Parabacteroides TaxID=375288 RepID=UPI001EDF1FCD|nr:FtsX-like permease family protein [Parabacteroides merdae]MCG4890090.1 secretin and TonB N-terminal domain-containing protein [Parabacteroides merdae]MCG4934588.1 secretin and TonB N-terminal domain-containing protein [Parabacteroides merdae]MCQ5219834.1 secretin and TonB N-terminal domain-containing protein [Parabacteroides merdae]